MGLPFPFPLCCLSLSFSHRLSVSPSIYSPLLFLVPLCTLSLSLSSFLSLHSFCGSFLLSSSVSPGPGDGVDSPGSSLTPHKPHTPTSATSSFSLSSSATTPGTGVGHFPASSTPDLDRSAFLVTRNHLTSGSTSGSVSLSGDYKDASGRMIKRYCGIHS